jgi:hypothetical protein
MTDLTSGTTRHRQTGTPQPGDPTAGTGRPEARTRAADVGSSSQSLAFRQDGTGRRTLSWAGRLRVLICRRCGTTELVQWCGERLNCGHPGCVNALEESAAAHRDPLNPKRFHGSVTLMQIDKDLYEEAATAEER